VRPTLSARIKYSVAIDDFVIFVLQKGKIIVSGKSLLKFLDKCFGIAMAVDADGQDLNVFFVLFV